MRSTNKSCLRGEGVCAAQRGSSTALHRMVHIAADVVEHRVFFLRKALVITGAVIYCNGSLPNGATGEERRGGERKRED